MRTKLVFIFPKDLKIKRKNLDHRFLKLVNIADEFSPRYPHKWTGNVDLGLGPSEYRKSKNNGLCHFITDNQAISLTAISLTVTQIYGKKSMQKHHAFIAKRVYLSSTKEKINEVYDNQA